VVAHLAPKLLGAGPALVGDLGISAIADALSLEVVGVGLLGRDVQITARPTRHTGGGSHGDGRS
jgi:diaminohydroxyphosphoribosylaminopyrimidine deaminase/5-amino-6-(5-phosphoribosylamino)uracil reductase